MKTILKGIGLGIAGVFFLTVVYASFFRDNTHQAMAIGSPSNSLEVELRSDEVIKDVRDSSNRIKKEEWIGKPFKEKIPEIAKYEEQVGDKEIIVSSTKPIEESKNMKELVKNLQEKGTKAGVVYLSGDIDDYKEAKKENKSFIAHLVEEQDIILWGNDEADVKNIAEKDTILHEKGIYYQTNHDLNRRKEEKRVADEKKKEERKQAEQKKQEEKSKAEKIEAERRVAQTPKPASKPKSATIPVNSSQRRPVQQNRRYYDDDDWDDADWVDDDDWEDDDDDDWDDDDDDD